MELGQLIKSLAGRDKGKHYLVVGFEGRRVLLSDGQFRPVNRPKRKNVKHLQPYRFISPEIQAEAQNNALRDTTIRNALNSLLAAGNGQKNKENGG